MYKDIKEQRLSNFELCRIISMLLLIAHHYCVHSGILVSDSPNKFIALLFLPMGKICFIAFLSISMWFLADKEFKSKGFLRLWLQVLFYSVTFCCLYCIIDVAVNGSAVSVLRIGRKIISSLLPIGGNSHGFAASYLLFYLLFPFIQKGIVELSKKQLLFLIALVFYAQVVEQILSKFLGYVQPIFSEIQLFILMFLILCYLKKYPIKILSNSFFLLFGFFLIYIYIFLTNFVFYYKDRTNIYLNFIMSLTIDESSLLYIIGGILFFCIFKNIALKTNAAINKIATFTFGVLLIHDHNFFRYVLWDNIIQVKSWFNSDFFLLLLLVSVISIFIACCFIDYCRQQVEKKIIKTGFFIGVSKKMDELILGR